MKTKSFKRSFLLALMLALLAGAAFLKFRISLMDRIAYNTGYDSGSLERSIDREALGLSSFHKNPFEKAVLRKLYNLGFEDAFQGKERRYADPASEQAGQAANTTTPSPTHHSPNQDETSPPGDYLMDSLYGDSPSQRSPSPETTR